MTDVKLQLLVRVRRGGDRILTTRAVAQDEVEVLTGQVLQPLGRRQLQRYDRHVGCHALDACDAGRHLLDRNVAEAGEFARLDRHVGLWARAAEQGEALCFVLGRQRRGSMRAVRQLALDQLAAAGATRAVLAPVGDADALPQRGGEHGFIPFDGEGSSARADRDLEAHRIAQWN